MSLRKMVWALAAMFSPALHAQTMTLANGSVTVSPGTRVVLEGPIEWVLGPGASIVNHGTIDLGEEASLVEPVGNPVTGQGVERATRGLPAPFASVEPGGLGLMLGMATGIGTVTITRGHGTFRDGRDSLSIARWYRIDAAPQQGVELDARLRYDPTELNGLSPAALVVHKTLDTTGGGWAPLESEAIPGTNDLTATDPSPWAWMTAFSRGIHTDVPEAPQPFAGFRAWPNPATDLLHVGATGDEPLRTIELMDARGRLVASYAAPHGGSSMATLDVHDVGPGILLLRVNGTRVIRTVKR